MVTRWGMSAEIGLVVLGGAEEGNALERGLGSSVRPYSEETARAIDQATRRIVDECYAHTLSLLTRERHRLDALAAAWLCEESLDTGQMCGVTGLEDHDVRARAIATTR
jgi:cell division protease FtsH